jgi:hypothetical protein
MMCVTGEGTEQHGWTATSKRQWRQHHHISLVTAWGITPVAEMSSLILTIQYAETPQEFENGEMKQIQTQITTQKAIENRCLELGIRWNKTRLTNGNYLANHLPS